MKQTFNVSLDLNRAWPCCNDSYMKTAEFSIAFPQDPRLLSWQVPSNTQALPLTCYSYLFLNVYTAPCSSSWINVDYFPLSRIHSAPFTHDAKLSFLPFTHWYPTHPPSQRHEFTVHKFFSGSHRSMILFYCVAKISSFQKKGQFLACISFHSLRSWLPRILYRLATTLYFF